jgi:signal-transduction protein with cAMP-binding, CBS, and nucleotidyltransferase domain
MIDGEASSAIVQDEDGRAVGIVTERDVSRRIAGSEDREIPITSVMTSPVITIDADEYLYHGIAEMRRRGLRHLPVVDAGGRVVGNLHLHQALAVAAARVVDQIERLTHADTLEGLKGTKHAQIQMALELMDDALPASEIQALISGFNDDLHRRVVRLCLREMEDAGRGLAPVDFEVIVMGSGGRGESLLHPDQDNGFILADYPPSEHSGIDTWFIELAERMTDALDTVGFPYCRGNTMATNPVWRKTVSEWCRQVNLWLGKSDGVVLRLCDIFFDFVHVYGSGDLARELRDRMTERAPHPFFLRELYRVDEEHGVALGFFGRLKTDPLEGPDKGKVNLKLTGTLPLVGAVRLLALRERIKETATLERIARLHERGILDRDEQDYLSGAYRHISGLLLRQQLEDFRTGATPGDHIPLDAMSEREKDMLVDGFKAIREFRSRVRRELMVEIL